MFLIILDILLLLYVEDAVLEIVMGTSIPLIKWEYLD